MERRVWRCKQLFEPWPQKPSGRYSCEALRWTANFRIDRADADVQQAWRCPVESNMKQLKPNYCKVSHSGIAIRWERINESKCIPSWEFAPHIGILGSLRYISSGSLSQHSAPGTPNKRHSGIHNQTLSRLGKRCNRRLWAGRRSTCHGVSDHFRSNLGFQHLPPQLPRCHLHGPAPACMALIAYQLIPNLPNPVNLPQGSRHIHHSQVQLPDLHMMFDIRCLPCRDPRSIWIVMISYVEFIRNPDMKSIENIFPENLLNLKNSENPPPAGVGYLSCIARKARTTCARLPISNTATTEMLR